MKVKLNRPACKGLLAGGLFLVTLWAATPALADAPIITPIPHLEMVSLDACPFPVQLSGVREKEKLMLLIRHNGDAMVLVTGALVVEVTNLTNNKSVTLNIPGSWHEVDYPDGSIHIRLIGPNLHWGLPGELSQMTLFNGLVEWGFDAAGNPTPIIIRGSTTPVCPLLAD